MRWIKLQPRQTNLINVGAVFGDPNDHRILEMAKSQLITILRNLSLHSGTIPSKFSVEGRPYVVTSAHVGSA